MLDGASWHKPDNYYILGDLESYVEAKLKANADYRDRRDEFMRKCWINLCCSKNERLKALKADIKCTPAQRFFAGV